MSYGLAPVFTDAAGFVWELRDGMYCCEIEGHNVMAFPHATGLYDGSLAQDLGKAYREGRL